MDLRHSLAILALLASSVAADSSTNVPAIVVPIFAVVFVVIVCCAICKHCCRNRTEGQVIVVPHAHIPPQQPISVTVSSPYMLPQQPVPYIPDPAYQTAYGPFTSQAKHVHVPPPPAYGESNAGFTDGPGPYNTQPGMAPPPPYNPDLQRY